MVDGPNGRARPGRRGVVVGVAGAAVVVAAVAAAGLGLQPGPATSPPPIAALPSSSPIASSSAIASGSPAASPPASIGPSPTPPLPADISDLTGERVDARLAHRLPLAVIIDDNRVARPQSGFNAAALVYQAPADGGETRYMLVFQSGDTRAIGPVRSGRQYFVQWAAEGRSAIGHYGGDRITRAYLAKHDGEQFTNVDALGRGARAFHRIASRRAPHNGYTSTVALRAMARRLGAPAIMPADLARRRFLDPAPLADRAAAQTIRIPYRTGIVGYRYDRAADLYTRILDGRVQVDPADRKVVTTRNVVVLFQTFRTDSTIERGHARPVLGSIGHGTAWVFHEGRLVKGTWRKLTTVGLLRLYDSTGAEIRLVSGRTFFQIVPLRTAVTSRA